MKLLLLVASVGMSAFSVNSATDVNDNRAYEPEISGPAHVTPGAWREKTQQLFDSVTRTISRHNYEIWDPQPELDLDFAWVPDDVAADRSGKINGIGYLAWYFKGEPKYLKASVYAEYRGEVRNGKIDGLGRYLDHTGLFYEGEWKDGLTEGQGTLKLSSGDEYIGMFDAGKAHGNGQYIDVTGEVFEGQFSGGRHHGVGKTTLPNGTSYSSEWFHGVESKNSRLVRLAQAGGQTFPGKADDLRIGVTVQKKFHSSHSVDESDGDLSYTTFHTKQALRIYPDRSRLMAMWKAGDDIALRDDEEDGMNTEDFGIFSLVKGQILPLTLILEVQNRSNNPVNISGATLVVRESISDLQPAIQLSHYSAFSDDAPERTNEAKNDELENIYYKSHLFIENFGWARAKNVKLKFRFVSKYDQRSGAEFSVNLPDIDKSVNVNFEDSLRKAGVNVNALKEKRAFECEKDSCLKQIRASGFFGSLADFLYLDSSLVNLALAGELSYDWEDQGGTKTKSSPFSSYLSLGVLSSMPEEGEGGTRVELTTKSQRFILDKSNYRIPISYSSNIAAGRITRFFLPVEAEKSSLHNFSIALHLADGRSIETRPIALTYFRPKWYATYGSQGQYTGDNYVPNSDLVGEDLAKIPGKDRESCRQQCQSNPECEAFTHDKWNNWCFTKRRVEYSRREPKNDSEFIRGNRNIRSMNAPFVIDRYRNKTFSGQPDRQPDQIQLRSSFEDCEEICQRDTECLVFTYMKGAGECRIFKSLADVHQPDAGSDSGVRRQRPN